MPLRNNLLSTRITIANRGENAATRSLRVEEETKVRRDRFRQSAKSKALDRSRHGGELRIQGDTRNLRFQYGFGKSLGEPAAVPKGLPN
jgi:hypothetical protein